jgi:hypothetical protein
MTIKKVLVSVLVLILLASVSACGGGTTATSDQQDSGQQAAVQAETDQQATVQAVLPSADSTATVDGLIGNWVDVNAADRFANITKTDSGFQYEDNEGKYPGTFKDGVMKIQITDAANDTADVYIDAKTGHMLSVYQSNLSEFKKK